MRRRRPRVWHPAVIPADVTRVKDKLGYEFVRHPTIDNSWCKVGSDGKPILAATASISTSSLVGFYGPITEVIESTS